MPTAPGLGLPNERRYGTGTASGTVLDLVTGLEWQAAVPDATFTWQEAKTYCRGLDLGDSVSFRLPTRIELVSLLDLGRAEPAIDGAAFPGTPGEWFWSASTSADDPTRAWYAYFYFGYPDVDDQGSAFRVRCVASPNGKATGGPRYQLGTGAVRDLRTGLTFQRHAAPEPLTHAEAVGYCSELELDGKSDWRLPSMQELETLVDERVSAPSIDDAAFPETAAVPFWSGSAWAGSPELAWYVSFDYGAALYELTSTRHAVRCAR